MEKKQSYFKVKGSLFMGMMATLLILLSSCVRKQGNEMTMINAAEPASLDIHKMEGVPEHRIQMSLFEGLLTNDPKTADPVPGVAERWEISDDGLQYTFYLRDAQWSDGVAITADTVVASWLRILDPQTASPYAWFPSMFLKGATAYASGEVGADGVGIRALGEKTFQFDLVGPLPYVLGAMTHYSFGIVPIHAIEKYGDEWILPENFVGNGPFVLEEWKPQEHLSAVKNTMYWDKDKVGLDRIVYLPVEDTLTALNMYKNGDVDWVVEIPLEQINAIKKESYYHNTPQLSTYYYLLENQTPPLDDPRVRKALSLVIDRDTLINRVTNAAQIPAYGIVPEMRGYSPVAAPFASMQESVAEAQRLMAEAGYPNGAGFPSFELLYNTSENHKLVAQFIQEAWKTQLGIDSSLINQEWKVYLSTRRDHEFAVARAGWVGDYKDPNTFLDMFVTDGGGNDGRYANAEYDALIAEASLLQDGEERLSLLKRADEILSAEDQGIIPLYYYTTRNLLDTEKWGGWYTNIMDVHPTKTIYKK